MALPTYEELVGNEQLPTYDELTGQVEAGNIDINKRPVVQNPDGTVSTEKSISIGTDKGEVLIPTVVNGKIVTNEEAKEHYKETGEHLGIFKTPELATKFAKVLHERQGNVYSKTELPSYDELTAAAPVVPKSETLPWFMPRSGAQMDALEARTLAQDPKVIAEAEQLLKGAHLQDIPLEVLEMATPFPGAYKAIKQAVDVVRGVPVEQAIPESQQFVGIEKKPLEERIKVGAETAIQLAFAKDIGKQVFPREPIAVVEPTVAREPVREELQPKAEATLPAYEELVASPKPAIKTADEAQKIIDTMEDKLVEKGVDITKLYNPTDKITQSDPVALAGLQKEGWQPMPSEMVEAYRVRDQLGAGELGKSVSELTTKLKSDTGLPDADVVAVLDKYAIKPGKTDVMAQYMASEHAVKFAQEPLQSQAESMAYRLAAERGEMFDELKDISPKTLRDAAKAVQSVREYFGLAESKAPRLAPKPAAAESVAGEGIRAATLRINGKDYHGVDHAAAVEDYANQKGITLDQAWGDVTSTTANAPDINSGFTTTTGRFVDIDEAAKIAKKPNASHAAELHLAPKPAAAESVAGSSLSVEQFNKLADKGRVISATGKSSAAEKAAVNAKPYESGKLAGYSEQDIAHFYKNFPGLEPEQAYKYFIDDAKAYEAKAKPAAAEQVEHPTTPEPTNVVAAPVAKQFEAEIKTNEELASPAAPAIGPAPVPRGQVLSMGDLPVTMPRTVPGQVSAPEVMDSLKNVITTSGGVGAIRTGRFKTAFAKGIFKPFSEVIRLEHINDVPTAVHETGHALMKQMYGTVKSRGLNGFPAAVKTELVGLGKALYGSKRPTAGYTAEGFSEFLRTYLTTDTARRQTPSTYRFFTEQVLKDHPEIAKQLEGSRKLIDTYRGQGAVARANSQIVNEPGWTKRTLGAVKDFLSVESFFESAQPLKQMVKEAEAKLGRKLRPGEDPYKLYKMKRGSTGPIVEAFVEHNTVDNFGNPTGPPLKEAFSEIKGKAEADKFMLYLFGRRAVERWSKGINPGIAREDAAYLRQTLESPKFDKAAGKYYDYWDNVLKYVVEAEPAMADTVTKIKQGSTDYAPLARMLDEGAAKREAMKMKSNPLHKMHGSGLPVKDIFQQTIVGTARLISRANRSLVMNSVVKLAQIEGMGKYIEEVPRGMAQKSVNFEGIRADPENLGLDTSKIPDDQILEYWTPADQPKGTDPIIPYRDATGQMHWYHVDPSIYRTLEALEPFSLKSIPHVGTTLDLLIGAPKRLFTLGTTGLRPTFSLITNPLRDPQAWLMQTKASVNPAKMAGAYFNGMRELISELATGKSGPYEAAIKNLGPQMSQQLGRDIKYTTKVTKGLFHGRVMRVVKSPIDHLRQLLNIPEAFPRHAEFQRVAEQVGWKPGDKMTADQAVEMALGYKEATVDFNAAGNVSRIVNEGVPFFNANLQGARTAARAFRDHPLRTTLLGLATLTTPTVLNWWKNKDEDWYKNLPWRERYSYSNIDDGEHVWQIPRPFEYSNLFQVLPEAALDSWYRKDPEALKAAVGQIFQTMNPLDLPVLARAAKEQWSNNIDFWDRPIIPKTEIDLVPGAQVGPYTSKIATSLGKAFPNTVSPRRVDAAMRSIGGGTIPDLLDMIGLGAEKKDRESEASDMAIAGKLFRRGGKYNAQSQHLADFWDIKDGVDARARAMVMQAKDPDRLQTIPINESDILMSKLFDKAAHRIKLTMQLTNDMRESKGRQQLYQEAAEQAKEMVEIYREQQRQDGQ